MMLEIVAGVGTVAHSLMVRRPRAAEANTPLLGEL
jgi:hypothetical protein